MYVYPDPLDKYLSVYRRPRKGSHFFPRIRSPLWTLIPLPNLPLFPSPRPRADEAWREMKLLLVHGGGHSMYDPKITHELVKATDAFADRDPSF
jgi:hypothetical protein